MVETCRTIIREINGKIYMDLFLQDFLSPDKKEERGENKKKLLESLKKYVSDLNHSIDLLNKILKIIKLNKRVEKIRFSEIKPIINQRFNEFYPKDKERQLADENLNFKILSIFQKTNKSLYEISKIYYSQEKIENFDKIPKKYEDDIKEAMDINSIGYPETAIFVIGRTAEKIVDVLIKKYVKLKKIKKIDVKKTKFENKIGILKNNKIIDDKQWHGLNHLRIDRNITVHPCMKPKTLKKTFKKNLLLTIDLIIELKKKL